MPGGNTQIGDASGTNTNATSNDDLYITGILEANGAGYFDSTLTLTGALTANGSVTLGDSSSDTITPNARLAASLLPSADSTYDLGSSTLAFSNLYVDTISGYNAALALSPASSYSLTGAVTKSASTGNEVAYDLAATINKATSGNYTGLKLNVTETLAPGSADKLLDLQVGGTSWLQLYNGVNSANYGLLSLGSDDWDGSTSGYFSGSASGTIIAVNAISGFVGNLLDLQVAGSSKYKVAYDGTVTSTGSQVVTGDITPSADSTYNLGSSSAAWLNLYTDNIKTVSGTNLTLLPTSAYTIVGDAASSLKASANDDLFVSGVLENAGAAYLAASSGSVGIGTTTPTALLHLKAGTTAASTAPLKFTSGSLNTTAEAGAVEFLTDDFYGTITTGAARKGFVLTDGSNLTSTRVPFATTNGRLIDDSDLTFATDTLSATKLLSSTSVSTPSLISTGAIGITPAAGSNLNVALSTTGDFAVNTNQLYVDTSAASVGIGNTVPAGVLHVGTSPSTGLVVLASGNVGIGTTAPVALLQAGTSPNPGLVVLASGNVGVGMTNPGVLLHIGTGGSVDSASTGDVYIQNDLEIDGTLYASSSSITGTSGTDFKIGSASDAAATNLSLTFGNTNSETITFTGAGTDNFAFSDLIEAAGLTLDANTSLTLSSGTGVYSQTYTGTATPMTITADSMTTGSGISISADALAGGNGIAIDSTSTAFAGKLLNLTASGAANTTTRYGVYSSLTGAGTTSTNIAGYFNSQNGTTANYGLIVENGYVGIGTIAPTALLQAGTSPNPGLLITESGNVGIGNTSPQKLLDVGTTPGTGLIVTTASRVGIGTTAPTAVLHLKAGTTAASTAPLKFTSGSLNTTAEAGAVEFLTDAYYGTITTGAARKTFAFLESPSFTTPNIGAATGTSLTATGDIKTLGNVGVGTTLISAGLLQVGTFPGSPLVVLDSGRLGVGTTAPGKTLDVTGTIRASDVITSTLADGTAPFTVTSTTRVANLNVATAGAADTVTTNANLTGPITSVGNATSIASQTGTGTKFVVDTSPTLVTPNIGAATGTSLTATGDIKTLGNVGVGTTLISAGLLQVGTFPGSPLVVLDSGRLGIGTTAPTAVLHLKAGTTAASTAPLKFTSGSLNTTAEAGAVEFLTDAYYGTITTGAARKTFAFLESPSFTTPNIGAATGTSLTATGDIKTLGNVGVGTTLISAGLLQVGTFPGSPLVVLDSGRVGVGTTNPIGLLQAGTSPNPGLIVEAGGSVGIGTTDPTGIFQAGTSPSAPVLFVDGANVGIGRTAPAQKLDINGTMRTTDTVPLLALAIYNPDASIDGIGKSLSKTKAYVLDKAESIITAGTNVIYTLKVVDTDGTTSLGNLRAGDTATTSILTVTSFTGGTVPAGKLLIMDTGSTSGTGTNTMFRLEIHGHEQ